VVLTNKPIANSQQPTGAIKSAGVIKPTHKLRFLTSNGQQLKQLSKSSSHLKVTNKKSANYNGEQYILPTTTQAPFAYCKKH